MLQIEYLDLLGIPFARGGRGPDTYDCYGLLIEMFKRKGVTLPDFVSPGTHEEVEAIMNSQEHKWTRVPAGTPGSLVRFRVDSYGAHVGFVLGNDKFLHANDPIGVCVERLSCAVRPITGFYDYV